jgi:pimeloyl-ACP methyl ester carboxylesterase
MSMQDITFDADGVRCSAWLFAAESDVLTDTRGRPAVVMAHGFGGTKDSGLEPFARRLAAAGLDVLAFDYRGFGASEGTPRQTISIKRQLRDYHCAIDTVQGMAGVDGQRIALWGASMSGGHVLNVAAARGDVAAVVALTPLTSGIAAGRASAGSRGMRTVAAWTARGLASRMAVARGGSPTMMPLVARPGEAGALALEGAYESYLAIAGPTWRNEVDAAVGIELGAMRTMQSAKELRSKCLVQIADFDRFVPASAVAKTAVAARAQVHHYPCDHFDVWPSHDWFSRVVDDQVAFLSRVLRKA